MASNSLAPMKKATVEDSILKNGPASLPQWVLEIHGYGFHLVGVPVPTQAQQLITNSPVRLKRFDKTAARACMCMYMYMC